MTDGDSVQSDSDKRLLATVVSGGYCIGCGACAALEGSGLQVSLDPLGRYQAHRSSTGGLQAGGAAAESVCPFSSVADDEDTIARRRFGTDGRHHPAVGYYREIYAGYVLEGKFRQSGSSGGMGTWLLSELLLQRQIDAVIHVKPREDSDMSEPLFSFGVSRTPDEVRQGAKSRYYPIELSRVLEFVKQTPGRYALTGLPCFIKAANLLIRSDPKIGDRLPYLIGLVCGHLKSTRYADNFAWQMGFVPGRISEIDFRHKQPGYSANQYILRVKGYTRDGTLEEQIAEARRLHGGNWGMGYFKYKACDYCDDVFAETADVTVGDAWLPRYVKDEQGTSLVVVRSSAIHELLETGQREGRIHLEKLSEQEAAASQDAGLRHRRDGLAYRLHLADRRSVWRPPKRVRPASFAGDRSFRFRHRLRMILGERSHRAFQAALDAGDYRVFVRKMWLFREAYLFGGRVKRLLALLLRVRKRKRPLSRGDVAGPRAEP